MLPYHAQVQVGLEAGLNSRVLTDVNQHANKTDFEFSNSWGGNAHYYCGLPGKRSIAISVLGTLSGQKKARNCLELLRLFVYNLNLLFD